MRFRDNKPRRIVPLLRITVSYGAETYTIFPQKRDPGSAQKAFRVRKQTGARQVLDILVTEWGPRCNCKSFRHHGRCQHLQMLHDAGMLD